MLAPGLVVVHQEHTAPNGTSFCLGGHYLYSPGCLEGNCPKSLNRPRSEASEVDETGRKSSVSLLWGPKMEAPEATLDPFRTVSLGNRVNRGSHLLLGSALLAF